MKKAILTLALMAGSLSAMAYDYAYLRLQKTDGSVVTVSTEGLTIGITGSTTLQLTVNGTAYEVADLRYMFFTNSATEENVVAIPSSGWATFCSTKPLDFTQVDGLNAYAAIFGASTVTLASLTSAVSASTGIVVSGEAGNYRVPVAERASAPADNDLLAATSSLTTTAGYSYYALSLLDDSTVGFRLINDGVQIPAGKAYYMTAEASAPLFYTLGTANTTGIAGHTDCTDNRQEAVYDLTGRRVTSPTKGIYIVNGKKLMK